MPFYVSVRPILAFVFFRNSKGAAGQAVGPFTQKSARKNCAEKWLAAEDEKEKGNRGVARSRKGSW